MSNISLDKETFFRRMKRLYAAWKVGLNSLLKCKVLLISCSKWAHFVNCFTGCGRWRCPSEGRRLGFLCWSRWRHALQQVDGTTGLCIFITFPCALSWIKRCVYIWLHSNYHIALLWHTICTLGPSLLKQICTKTMWFVEVGEVRLLRAPPGTYIMKQIIFLKQRKHLVRTLREIWVQFFVLNCGYWDIPTAVMLVNIIVINMVCWQPCQYKILLY